MLIASRQDRERLGLAQALEACRCYSPQGRRLKAAHRYYAPEEKELLEEELTAVNRLLEYAGSQTADRLTVQAILGHLRDLRGSLASLKKGYLLDITELFELKQAARLIGKLAGHASLARKVGVTLTALPELEALLDPAGLGTSGFYLYDDYSPRLAQLRRDRALLENKLEGGQGDRPALLAERRCLVEEEEKEEEAVRRQLCERIKPYAAPLQENLDQAGRLDFRLAKAEKDALEHVFAPIRAALKKHNCQRAILVGHNAHFDLGFINAAVARSGHKRNPFHPFSVFDTVTLGGVAFGQTVLARAVAAAGIEFDASQAHSAVYDTEKTAELFCHIANQWPRQDRP